MKISKKAHHPFTHAILLASVMFTTSGCISDADGPPKIEIVEVNSAPIITSSAPLTVQALSVYRYTVTASDNNALDTLTFTVSALPSWLTFNAATGELTGTPSIDDIGEFPISIVVNDGKSEATQSFVITVSVAQSGSDWSLVWSDEFDGSSLNTDNWTIETGDGSQYGISGWGNNELEWYSADNISLADGNLVITAKEQSTNGYPYTSGRLRSDHKVDIKYGRIEARIKTPVGQGLWSAFWMLPTDSQYGGWASGGEIDIMEVLNAGTPNSEDKTYGTIHYGMSWPLNASAGADASITSIDDFHIYAIEWQADEIRWYIDDLHYATVNADHWWSYYYAGLEQGYVSAPDAPFNQNFHLLLNLAVGGNWPGSPNTDTVFDAQMLVDYVRVYQCDSGLASGAGCANNINATVAAPAPEAVFTARYPLFNDDGVNALTWTLGEQIVTRALTAAVAWDNGGISVVEQSSAEHGLVLDINTQDMGNVAISAADGNTISLFGMGNNPAWWELGAGELKFDLYIDSANTPEDSIIAIKMDSGWPKLGYKNFAVADLPKDSWTSVSVKINDLIQNSGEQPLNTSAVLNLFVIEFSAAAHVQLDNIALVCGHKNVDGCGITPPVVEVTTEVLTVFSDSVNDAIWSNGIGAWDTIANTDYYAGDTNNHVNWALIDTAESGHDTVIEVNFNADGGDGVFYIQSASPVDLTAFSTGNLLFDIKVTDYASTASGISFKVDCIYPCTTGDQLLGVVGNGEWQTISIPVSDLVAQGLNLRSTNTGLVVFPTWGDQQGVTFQLDNVRWQVGEDSPEPETPEVGSGLVIYAEGIDSNWSLWDCCGGATVSEQTDDGDHGLVGEISFNSVATVSGFEAATPHNASRLTNGTLEFDLKMVSAPLDSSANWLLKLESVGAATSVELMLNTSIEGLTPSLDVWQHFTFNLDSLSDAGLDLSTLKLIMIFPDWGKADGAVYRIDNVVLKTPN